MMQQDGQGQQEAAQPGQEDASSEASAHAQAEVQLIAAQQKADEYLELLQRTQADFINYRRRVNQEQVERRLAAQGELLVQLLPAFDDLERALKVVPPHLSSDPWVQGLFLVARRLATLLEQLGVRQIGVVGEQFDPRLHEAIATEPRADLPGGTIARVEQPGYILGDRVIRPAQVLVAGPAASTSDVSVQQHIER